jgi:alpha-L-rhamnosidase
VTVPLEAGLPPDAECRWRVRLQDANGIWGPWSEEQAFGTGLRDSDWTAQWIAREAGGRAPLRIEGDALRWHGTPFLAVPAVAGPEFVLEAELQPLLGPAGIAFHSAGPGTGLLLEFGRDGRLALRTLPAWNQPAEPFEWATAPLAEAFVEPFPGEPDDSWRRVRIEATGGRLAVAVGGHHALGASLPAPAGTAVALHAAPRAEGGLRSLTLTDGSTIYRYDAAVDGLDGWPKTTPFRQPDEWTLLHAELPLTGTVRRAVLYGAARHQAWVSIAGREVLALSSFGYPGEDYYDAADITKVLRAGGGSPAIEILAHWYGPGQGRASTEPGVLAELRVEYDDGRRVTLGTGPQWRVAEAPYGQAGYRNDEGDPIEQSLGDGASDWTPARVLGPHPHPEFPAPHPRRAHTTERREEPVRWLTADDGTPVADFGTVRARRPRAEVTAGASRLRGGYVLKQDGRVDDGKTASQNTDMSFVSGPGPGSETFDARVHLAFRYLEIEGNKPARLEAAVVHAAHPAEAAVETSDPQLNAVLRLLQDSALHGVQERFVDTPTREKGQFLADAANISYATMAAFGEREFTRQALREFAWSGLRYWDSPEERGRVNAVYPNGDGKRDIPDFSLMLPEWAEAYWRHAGDDAFIAELLPTLEATCGYVLRSIPADGPFRGLVTRLEGGSGPYLHGIVDWPAPNRFGYDMETVGRTTVNAQAYSALTATARLCAGLGHERRAAMLHEQAGHLAVAMESRLRVDGVLVDGLLDDGTPSRHASQHATVFPLAVGATAPEWRADDAARAAALGLRMGPMTWHRLLAALVDGDRVDDALGLILDDPSRGPLSWLAQGATFAWESWELAPGSDHSQSHAWSAAAWPVLMDGILGLRRLAPGQLELDPPSCRLEWVRAELPLEQGTLRLAWRRTAEGVDVECDVPPGVALTR